jgi:hypothetical protein
MLGAGGYFQPQSSSPDVGLEKKSPDGTQLVGNQVFCFTVSSVLFNSALAIFKVTPHRINCQFLAIGVVCASGK